MRSALTLPRLAPLVNHLPLQFSHICCGVTLRVLVGLGMRSILRPTDTEASLIYKWFPLPLGLATTPSHRHRLFRRKMQKIPQEVLDLVIDELAGFDPSSQPNISNYSTISRRWVHRTQKHHFNLVIFKKKASLKKWRKTFKPDPSGVSQHVRKVRCYNIRTLARFEDHLRAFTNVEEAHFEGCGAFRSLRRIRPLTALGSSLVRLEIYGGVIKPTAMAFLFRYFPRLRRLLAQDFRSPSGPG